ncbi:MAG: Gar1/Naf1 family protein [Candidatus Thermoplasmatota archaeon]
MKPIGTVATIAHNGHLIVRARFAPDEGCFGYDSRGRVLGRIIRVFGPVSAPFVAILPARRQSLALMGAEAFVDDSAEGSAGRASRKR